VKDFINSEWLLDRTGSEEGARLGELLRVVRVEPIAEQCRTLASIAAAARDDRGLDDRVPGGLAALDESRQCHYVVVVVTSSGLRQAAARQFNI
jgi:hypothetical protein